MSPADSMSSSGEAAMIFRSPSSGPSTTARPPVAAASCSVSAVAASPALAAPDSRRVADSTAAIPEARREVARAWSRTRPVSQPVASATAKKTAKVRTSAAWPMNSVSRGSRKKKL